MKNILLLMVFMIRLLYYTNAQNVGINISFPTEKLHIDSGNIKIGKLPWNSVANSHFLKFGDADYITLGEDEQDDYLLIKAKNMIVRPSSSGYLGNIGLNTDPQHARLEINGSLGAAVAMFGADKHGVTIEADNPEIGFNYYYNSGAKTIKAGYGGFVGMNTGNGDIYLGNFSGNQSSSDFGAITGYNQPMTIKQNGLIGFGMTTPSRAYIEQNGAGVIGNTAALFGGDGAGVSLQKNWPAIGFNHWFDGTYSKSISTGYAAQMGVDQTNGALYITNFNTNSVIPNGLLLNPITNLYFRNGKIGIGTNNPNNPLSIYEVFTGTPIGNLGIHFSNELNTDWNIYATSSYFYFINASSVASYISGIDGSYHAVSDKRMKKNIDYITDNNMLKKILLLKPATYLMKSESASSPLHMGFISQDVEQVFPEFVNDNNGIKMLGYQSFIPVIVKGMQEQQEQITVMNREIELLKKQNEELRKLILSK